MKAWHVWTIWLLAVAVLMGAVGFAFLNGFTQHSSVARQKLDRMLGQSPSTQAAPDYPQQPGHAPNPSADPTMQQAQAQMNQMMAQMNQLNQPMNLGLSGAPDITVQETPQAYVLSIPMAHADDQKNIHLQLSQNSIALSGQFNILAPDGKTVMGHSSLSRMFTTSQPIVPRRTTRVWKDNRLVITIPKQNGRGGNTLPAVPNGPGVSPEVRQQLQRQGREFI